MSSRRQLGQAASAGARIRAAYETLRTQILEPGPYVQRELGMAVLMNRGLAAWIDTWWPLTTPVVSEGSRTETLTVVPEGVQGEVVMLLTGMVLHTASVEVGYGE